jgi:hypothetical protein
VRDQRRKVNSVQEGDRTGKRRLDAAHAYEGELIPEDAMNIDPGLVEWRRDAGDRDGSARSIAASTYGAPPTASAPDSCSTGASA